VPISGAQAVMLMGALEPVSLRHWTPQAAGAETGSTGVSQESGTVGSGMAGPQASLRGADAAVPVAMGAAAVMGGKAVA